MHKNAQIQQEDFIQKNERLEWELAELLAENARLTDELREARETIDSLVDAAADIQQERNQLRAENERLKADAAQFWDDWLHLSQQIGAIEDAILGLDEWANASLEDFEEFDPWWPVQQAARLLQAQNLYAEYYEQHIRGVRVNDETADAEFLKKTKDVEGHPVWWEWHCLCRTCQDDGTR